MYKKSRSSKSASYAQIYDSSRPQPPPIDRLLRRRPVAFLAFLVVVVVCCGPPDGHEPAVLCDGGYGYRSWAVAALSQAHGRNGGRSSGLYWPWGSFGDGVEDKIEEEIREEEAMRKPKDGQEQKKLEEIRTPPLSSPVSSLLTGIKEKSMASSGSVTGSGFGQLMPPQRRKGTHHHHHHQQQQQHRREVRFLSAFKRTWVSSSARAHSLYVTNDFKHWSSK
ncbi:hypothetical protein BDZ97DRAFT_1755884 [Flammula alnicola]|nr:hypothetical protein BDZ97DRAFT_1755884 [Flammula alnicola]